ncbi:lipopolysaccharide biosynthesis protein [Pantoea sp. JK]|uniref:lipopolysaccharide biosynthesis protein n=1 Tax=Pantoea sp. JK TaxID=2871703 RepID=UPI002238B2DA|nr:oligosaccharide flippase family protein [Pantoea sp. JK]MCW6033886.1 oligosaccharide flippase family protein [Pantoea sp. JK]
MKNKTIRDFANYALGDLFVKGFLFISLPLLSRILDPAEYGKLSIINTAIMILYVFVSLNLQNAITNRYMLTAENFGDYFKSILVFILPFQVALLILSPLYSGFASGLLGIDSKDFLWVLIICIMLSYLYMYTCYLQASRQSGLYVKINMLSKILEITLIFAFAYFMTSQQYMSKIYSQLIVTAFILVYLSRKLIFLATGRVKVLYIKEALVFSIPLIVHVLSNSLLSQADRIIINNSLGSSAAGIYSFTYNISTGILVLIMAWNSSWQPRLYNHIENNRLNKIREITKASTVIIFSVSSLAILFSREMIMLIAEKSYFSGIKILPIVIIGNAIIHLYLIYVNFIFYKKKSILISTATLLAVMVNVGLNYLLIPILGILGSAWATVFSYLLLTILHYITSTYIVVNNPLSAKYIIYFPCGLIIMYLLSILVDSNCSYLIGIMIKFIMMIVIGLVIIKTRVHKSLSE